jgi:hypothetical protein
MDIIKGKNYVNCFSGNTVEVTDHYVSFDDTWVVEFKIIKRSDGQPIDEAENEFRRPHHSFEKCFIMDAVSE